MGQKLFYFLYKVALKNFRIFLKGTEVAPNGAALGSLQMSFIVCQMASFFFFQISLFLVNTMFISKQFGATGQLIADLKLKSH